MEKITTKWTLSADLKAFTNAIKGRSDRTIANHIRELCKKYEPLMAFDADSLIQKDKKIAALKKAYLTLKFGRIHYVNKTKGIKGVLILNDVMSVEKKQDGVLVKTKNGIEIPLGTDFLYIYDLFDFSGYMY